MDDDIRGSVTVQFSVKKAILEIGKHPTLSHATLEVLRRDEAFLSKMHEGSMTILEARRVILQTMIQTNERLAMQALQLRA